MARAVVRVDWHLRREFAFGACERPLTQMAGKALRIIVDLFGNAVVF